MMRNPESMNGHGMGVLTERNDYSGAACIDELNFILCKHLMKRRLKRDVLG